VVGGSSGDRIVFLGASPNQPADKLKSRSLFIVDRMTPTPTADAFRPFNRVMREILRFLNQ